MKLRIHQNFRELPTYNTLFESFIETAFQEQRTRTNLAKLFLVVFGTTLITLSSYITIPLYPVPVTAQTLVVLLIGLSYGSQLASLTIGCYLLQGTLGLPVFAGTPAKGVGVAYLLGPTGGYILGYAFTAFLAGLFFSKRNFFYNKKNLPNTFIKLAIALIPTYLIGTLWLGIIIGFDKPILEMGFYPFVISECLKILLLAILIHKYSRLKIF